MNPLDNPLARFVGEAQAICPGFEAAAGRRYEKTTWELRFPDTCTSGQRAAIEALFQSFDASPAE